MVTLLLTFFVLLLSFAKTETAKYEAALGSIRNAFGGNVLKHGEVIQRGKSPDDSPSMIESQEPIKPFPIEFLTMEGLLDKNEINRESTETLNQMKNDLYEFGLNEYVNIYEEAEGIKVRVKDQIVYKKGSLSPEEDSISVEVFSKMVKLLSSKSWVVFVEGHASADEITADGKYNALTLSAARAAEVTSTLIRQGVPPERITTVFYGATRPNTANREDSTSKEYRFDRRVEFLIRKTDLRYPGHKVDSL